MIFDCHERPLEACAGATVDGRAEFNGIESMLLRAIPAIDQWQQHVDSLVNFIPNLTNKWQLDVTRNVTH